MAGLYIHIPFCRSKCAYCDFYSLPVGSVLKKDPCSLSKYLKAILTELEMRAGEINEPINTIYIGGGTPTAVPMPELTDFISLITKKTAAINRRFQTSKILEFTIEANPEDISRESIDGLRQAGIDRISIGIQSFETAQLEAVIQLVITDKDLAGFRATSLFRIPALLRAWDKIVRAKRTRQGK